MTLIVFFLFRSLEGDNYNSTQTNCSENHGYGDGSTSTEAYISAIVIGFVRLVASLLLSKLLRRFRRRSMYFTSAALTIVSLASFATCTIFIQRFVFSKILKTNKSVQCHFMLRDSLTQIP
jgi:hypothetical protein